VNNPERIAELGEKSRELVVKEYSWKSTANKFIKIYKKAGAIPNI
jgi:glycosyltransferase involved in cell wall biosynthesis